MSMTKQEILYFTIECVLHWLINLVAKKLIYFLMDMQKHQLAHSEPHKMLDGIGLRPTLTIKTFSAKNKYLI